MTTSRRPSDDDLHGDVGQLLIGGFSDPLSQAPESFANALGEGILSGAILFRRNVESVEQVASLCESIHEAVGPQAPPPFVCLDQEGGRVVRLRSPLTPIPPMRLVGEQGNTDLAASISEMVATEVSALGFNVNFAPVLDVDTNPDNPVIGDRAFGDDPHLVARMGGAWILGHTMAGVIPCGKHFPGHGDTDLDSHLALPTITHDLRRLDDVELVPFRKTIKRANAPMIMTAHIVVTALDPELPATLSPAVIEGILRKQYAFEGVVVSDCLEMRAVSELFEIEELVERSLMAGVDLFLICHTEQKWRRAHTHLVSRAKEDEGIRARIGQSAARVRHLKNASLKSWPKPWTRDQDWRDQLGAASHHDLVARLGGVSPSGADPTEA